MPTSAVYFTTTNSSSPRQTRPLQPHCSLTSSWQVTNHSHNTLDINFRRHNAIYDAGTKTPYQSGPRLAPLPLCHLHQKGTGNHPHKPIYRRRTPRLTARTPHTNNFHHSHRLCHQFQSSHLPTNHPPQFLPTSPLLPLNLPCWGTQLQHKQASQLGKTIDPSRHRRVQPPTTTATPTEHCPTRRRTAPANGTHRQPCTNLRPTFC